MGIPQICDRCHFPTKTYSMSYFNEEMCCPSCIAKEKKHPKYAEAKRIELEEVKKGNLNFPGIGLPEDLK